MRLVNIIWITLFFVGTDSVIAERVKGHLRKNGKYVMPHNRSNKDRTKVNNWSHKGNVNPYTGKKGQKK